MRSWHESAAETAADRSRSSQVGVTDRLELGAPQTTLEQDLYRPTPHGDVYEGREG